MKNTMQDKADIIENKLIEKYDIQGNDLLGYYLMPVNDNERKEASKLLNDLNKELSKYGKKSTIIISKSNKRRKK